MKEVSHTMKLTAATMLAILLGSYLYSSSANAADVADISKVNGGVRVSAKERVGDISSVNGGIERTKKNRRRITPTVGSSLTICFTQPVAVCVDRPNTPQQANARTMVGLSGWEGARMDG